VQAILCRLPNAGATFATQAMQRGQKASRWGIGGDEDVDWGDEKDAAEEGKGGGMVVVVIGAAGAAAADGGTLDDNTISPWTLTTSVSCSSPQSPQATGLMAG
jgi:hypothetical protein